MAINGNTLQIKQPIKAMLNRKAHEHGVSHGRSEAGYDIRIKQAIHFSKGWFGKRFVARSDSDPEGYLEEVETTGRFMIASAIEEFNMPNDLMAIVHDKSTWARRGLSVFNTVIEPGWKGFLTLELVYHGEGELYIPAGSGIAQVVFDWVSDPVAYTGKYQDQENKPVAAIAS